MFEKLSEAFKGCPKRDCLLSGDGHDDIWNLFAQIAPAEQRFEILDWYHLVEHLHGVGGSIRRLEFDWDIRAGEKFYAFFAFGPLGVSPAYYSQTKSWSVGSIAAAIIVGIITSLILFCSHFNQVNDDLAAGKRSPVVRLGTKRAAQLLPWVCSVIYAITIIAIMLHFFPTWTAIVLISLPIAWRLCSFIRENHDRAELLLNYRFIAVALHFVVGSCLSISLIL